VSQQKKHVTTSSTISSTRTVHSQQFVGKVIIKTIDHRQVF